MNRKLASFFLMIVLFTGTLGGCGKGMDIPELKLPASESLQGVSAQKKNIEQSDIVTGFVTGEARGCYYKETKADLEYKVKLGDKVSKGQELVVADSTDLEDQIEALKQELECVKAELAYQKEYSELNQSKLELQAENSDGEGKKSAQTELEKARIDQEYQENLLNIQITNLNKQIDEVKGKIADNTLYAELDGYVSYISYMQYASAFVNLLVITDTDSLYIAMEENAGDYIRAYMLFDGQEIELDEIPYSEAEKKVAEKSSMILNTRFKMASQNLKLGDYVNIHLVMEESKDAVVVSRSCIYESEEEKYVYRIRDKSREKCFVETGIEGNTEIQIISGIEEGDLIFYPVDETVTYEGTQTVKRETIPVRALDKECSLFYPSTVSVKTGVGDAELVYIRENGPVEKGELLATINVAEGKADVKEAEGQITSLKKQYQQQKDMHDKMIKALNKELSVLIENKEESKKETAEDKEGKEDEESGTSKENEETGVDETAEENEEKTPVSKEDISLKKLEISMEKLTQKYDETNYNLQLKKLEKNLKHLRGKTGEVSIYAPIEGTFERDTVFDTQKDMEADSWVGNINNTSLAYLRVENGENILHYGDKVTVTDQDGKEYEGEVVGAYSSGQISITVSDMMGSYSYTTESDENQKNAYIRIKEDVELERGALSYQSNVVKDIITINKDLLKREEDKFYVWILKDGKPYKQYIEYDQMADDKLWIFNGLSENDILLTGVK